MSNIDELAFEEIQQSLTTAFDAWYSGNPYPYSDLFTEKITYFDPMTPERIETRDALRAHYAGIEGQFVLPRYEIVAPIFDAIGERRLLTYFLKQFSADGPFGPTWKTTEIYNRVDDQWRIEHAHWSAIPPDQ